tara:strand:- start:1753 stop:2400 length:648 start_codon:yes stop_codon:yes gene_type:complete
MNTLHLIAIIAIPLLFAVTVHEAAHGFVANYYGDPTARLLGRLTLNPIKHIDPIGTILVPAMLIFLNAGFIFGWAKPVPIGYRNFKNPKKDMAIVAAAGPLSNLVMAIGWAVIAKVFDLVEIDESFSPAFQMGLAGIQINLILMILNFIPIPPLDGSRVVSAFLPPKAEQVYNSLEPYGFFILIALIFTGILAKIMMPIFIFFFGLILNVFGMSP